jgi:hypothetical protein
MIAERGKSGYQGDRKGAPLLYTQNEYNGHRSIVGAHPCGRPGGRGNKLWLVYGVAVNDRVETFQTWALLNSTSVGFVLSWTATPMVPEVRVLSVILVMYC